MNHPHEQQAAAMERAGELTDGEQLRECINSGQVSAAQVVAHAEAGELPELPKAEWLWNAGPTHTSDQMRAYAAAATATLAAERAEVVRLRDALTAEREKVRRLTIAAHGVLANFDGLPSDHPARYAPLSLYLLRATLTAPGDKHD